MIPVVKKGRKPKYPEIETLAKTEQPLFFRSKKEALAFRTAVYRKKLFPVMQCENGLIQIFVKRSEAV